MRYCVLLQEANEEMTLGAVMQTRWKAPKCIQAYTPSYKHEGKDHNRRGNQKKQLENKMKSRSNGVLRH